MKDIAEIIRQKEQDILRVRREVEALRLAASLLSDETPSNGNAAGPHPLVHPVIEMKP